MTGNKKQVLELARPVFYTTGRMKSGCSFLLKEVRAISGTNRQEMLACCGLSDEELRVLEEAGGVRAGERDYQETVGLAAALRQAGFSLEEIRRYFQDRAPEARRALLTGKRWDIVREIHDRQLRLSKVDYLLYLERREGPRGAR